MALAPDAESTFWYVAWTPYTNPFLRYVRDLAAREDIADVHSLSYLNDEIEVRPETQQLFNTEVNSVYVGLLLSFLLEMMVLRV
jgi:hypothetical protein